MVFPYFEFAIGFSLIVYTWETFLNLRQRTRLAAPKPANMTYIDTETFVKSSAYSRDKSTFGLVQEAWNISYDTLLLVAGMLPIVWNYSGDVIVKYGYTTEVNTIIHALVFNGITMAFTTVIGIPFSLYSTFVIEEKHGFNKQTLRLFITDFIKSQVLTVVIGIPLMSLLFFVIEWGGEYMWLWITATLFIVQIIAVAIYPTLIQPCFNKVEKLETGPLRDSIEALAKSISFPLTQLYKIDGSKRSSHSNAYFYGFFKQKRIVIYDTLIEQSTIPEVTAILGHELGHWKKGHTIKGLVIHQIEFAFQMFVFGQFMNNTDLFAAFGFKTKPVCIGLVLFSMIYSPLSHALSFLGNLLSRHHEFEADRFAVDLGFAQELATGLVKLQKKNLSNMNPDPWYSSYHYSHPPLVERLAAIHAAKPIDYESLAAAAASVVQPKPATTGETDSTSTTGETNAPAATAGVKKDN